MTDRQMNISDSRVAFVIEKLVLKFVRKLIEKLCQSFFYEHLDT